MSARVVSARMARLWQFVRTLAGEQAYADYLAHLRLHHPEREPLTATAFYRQRELRKWEGIQRCC